MTRYTLPLLLLLSLPAHAAKPCEELKAEIVAKLEAKKVIGYSLEIVPAAEVGERRVVGSCAAGSQKIVYKRS